MKLTDRFEDYFYFNGIKIQLNLSFDTVLRAFELDKDTTFDWYEKLHILIEMFVETDINFLTIEDKMRVIETVFKNFISENDDNQQNNNGEKVFDINQDAPYIYASFLSEYNMDLFEMQGKLHWHKFQSLLKGLSDKAKLNQVIGIRTAEIPKPDKTNAQERARLRRLKELYALKLTEKELEIKVKNFDDKLSSIASRFKPKAVRK